MEAAKEGRLAMGRLVSFGEGHCASIVRYMGMTLCGFDEVELEGRFD